MNCQEFQSNVDGLARGALLDARTRDAAAAHEEACVPCAARLADERALTAGLRALAASMREESAPARAEAALLSAFRPRAAAASVEVVEAAHAVSTLAAPSNPSNPSNVVALSDHAVTRQWSWVRTVAVASMAAAAALALFMLVPPYLSTPAPLSVAKKTQSAPFETQGVAGTSAGQKEVSQTGEEKESSSPKEAGAQTQKTTDERVTTGASTQRRGVVRGAMNVSYVGTPRGVAPDRNSVSETASANEITTEFIPLTGFTQSEGVHLVRVELPRSALASFGIPVNAEQSGGRVKADVLLGEDGTARAIRFVR